MYFVFRYWEYNYAWMSLESWLALVVILKVELFVFDGLVRILYLVAFHLSLVVYVVIMELC